MNSSVVTFVSNHINWVVAVLCFYQSFSGIVLKQMGSSPPHPWDYLSSPKYIYGSQAAFVGFLFLAAGIVAIFNVWYGAGGAIAASLLAWLYGLTRPTL